MKFASITAQTYKNKIVMLETSTGANVFDANGLTAKQVLDFLFAQRDKKSVFVWYVLTQDFEIIFSELANNLKDKIFKSKIVTDAARKIDAARTRVYDGAENADNKAEYLAKYASELKALKDEENELEQIEFAGYKLTYAAGKRLTISQNKQQIEIFDIFGFFRVPLQDAVEAWTNVKIEKLNRSETFIDAPLFKNSEEKFLEMLKEVSALECKHIAELANLLDEKLIEYNIVLRSFHGASAITGQILADTKARSEYKNYKFKHTVPHLLYNAMRQSYFGARIEQIKLGSFNNVFVYDINSAYAAACLFLPKLLKRPTFQTEWTDAPFSCWQVEYDFCKLNLPFCPLPFRTTSGAIIYPQSGRGTYWQPELIEVIRRYPDCINITGGYVWDYVPAKFPTAILELYEIRKQLKAENHPLAKTLKLALACLYGKFCQHVGKAYYYNLFYAGFITSYVRAELFKATISQADKIISFNTDGFHATAKIGNTSISNEIGDYRLEKFDTGDYLASGIYQLKSEAKNKTAIRGFHKIDFDKSVFDIMQGLSFAGTRTFLVGHNLARNKAANYGGEYLSKITRREAVNPFDLRGRDYFAAGDVFESTPERGNVNANSVLYENSNYSDFDLMLDALTANRF